MFKGRGRFERSCSGSWGVGDGEGSLGREGGRLFASR